MSVRISGLYTLVDNTMTPEWSHRELALAYLQGGAKILQLRMKNQQDRSAVLRVAQQIRALKAEYDFCFIINDYLDIAHEVKADGYHGGAEDPSIAIARQLLGTGKMIGYSSHSLEEAVEAERSGADYVAFGAIYPSPSKGGKHPVQGLEKLKAVVTALTVPVVAIGGINRDNIEGVLSTGVASVAMISALLRSDDIMNEVKFYAARLS